MEPLSPFADQDPSEPQPAAAPADAPPAEGVGADTGSAAATTRAPEDGYEPAVGFDRATTEAKRSLEPVVYDKVVSDMTHVVWAYGIIFALFAVYAVTLWRRARSLSTDLDALRREVDRVRDAS
jgi:hypothetical protein